jgi:hypothetical protein
MIFLGLQYPLWTIEKAHMKARNTFYLGPKAKNKESKYLIMPYSPDLSNFKKWGKAFNLEVAFQYKNTIERTLIQNKPKDKATAGVYTIPCIDCKDTYYVGETGRSLSKRIDEHTGDIKRNALTSSLYQHSLATRHILNLNGAKIIYNTNNYLERKVVESTLIKELNNFNMSEGQYKMGPLLHKYVYHKIKHKLV